MIEINGSLYWVPCGWDFADIWIDIGWEFHRRVLGSELRGGNYVKR